MSEPCPCSGQLSASSADPPIVISPWLQPQILHMSCLSSCAVGEIVAEQLPNLHLELLHRVGDRRVPAHNCSEVDPVDISGNKCRHLVGRLTGEDASLDSLVDTVGERPLLKPVEVAHDIVHKSGPAPSSVAGLVDHDCY